MGPLNFKENLQAGGRLSMQIVCREARPISRADVREIPRGQMYRIQ